MSTASSPSKLLLVLYCSCACSKRNFVYESKLINRTTINRVYKCTYKIIIKKNKKLKHSKKKYQVINMWISFFPSRRRHFVAGARFSTTRTENLFCIVHVYEDNIIAIPLRNTNVPETWWTPLTMNYDVNSFWIYFFQNKRICFFY